MKPPICAICGKQFSSDQGGLVAFKPTAEEMEYNKALEQKGMVGHPANMEWFCEEHLPAAQNLAHLSKGEAIRKLATW
ncbi:MAG TPA: hypothetical protein VIK89_16805 [Cytophagaceae bacterium]